MKREIQYSLVFCLLIFHLAHSQDVHFSQYYFSPLSLNPANTGNFKGDYRLFGNYRTQWRNLDKGYNTYSAGGDMNFYPDNLNVSPGLMIISDKSALNLSVTKIMPSAAVHLKLAGFKFHIGVQPGVVIKTLDFYNHSFPNQLNWNTGSFDKDLPNIETNVGQRFTYFDLNAGGAISKKLGRFEGEVGCALFHINNPRESFLSDKQSHLPGRQAYNIGLGYDLGKYVVVKVHSLYGYTTLASDWVSGVNLEYVISSDAFFRNSVFVGFMWRDGFNRNFDASILTAGMHYQNYTIGFSYDITNSPLKTSVDSKGAYEIAIIYRGKSTRLSRKVIPCERF